MCPGTGMHSAGSKACLTWLESCLTRSETCLTRSEMCLTRLEMCSTWPEMHSTHSWRRPPWHSMCSWTCSRMYCQGLHRTVQLVHLVQLVGTTPTKHQHHSADSDDVQNTPGGGTVKIVRIHDFTETSSLVCLGRGLVHPSEICHPLPSICPVSLPSFHTPRHGLSCLCPHY
ncbi:hypothetical protein JAAARDRAFT_345662 [Jaapia argillacea MUCL 33604]|uniref:Uncharacterized protein n=1 Tax=Jaapia argillacea MUCL 33604 TaxID=933084 RepID=A0A067PK06_9AGAM|nr:hypothetical protein JAAARDRAFT_345662 [Jaapia argillacea MUCL 33604]